MKQPMGRAEAQNRPGHMPSRTHDNCAKHSGGQEKNNRHEGIQNDLFVPGCRMQVN